MRVAVVAEYYPRRRDPVLGVWAHRQALAARAAGAELTVLALERPVPPLSTLRRPGRALDAMREFAAEPRHSVRDGIPVELVRFLAPPRARSYASWHRWARLPLERALGRVGPVDVVHAHYALPAGGAAARWARRKGVPLVLSIHGGDVLGPAVRHPRARRRIGAILREANVVLCNSRSTLELSAGLAGSDSNMRVLHLGADPPPEPASRRAAPTVATLGHVIARKRHADVLRAIRLARRRIPDLEWLVIGEGPERRPLEHLVARLGLTEAVHFEGQLPPAEALAELARCHLMALPSVDEAFGVAYIEALAAGVPAIGSRGEGGPEEIAAHSDSMLLVPPGDPEALAALMGDLLNDEHELHALSSRARADAARHFSWEACGKGTVAAYEEAAS